MTIEGRPELDFDWKSSFIKQRRERLQSSVDEYMQDGEVNEFFEDLRSVIQELIDYHSDQKSNAEVLMKVVSGHRPLERTVSPGLCSLTGPDSTEPIVITPENWPPLTEEEFNESIQFRL